LQEKEQEALLQTEQETDVLEESWCTSEQADEKTPEAARNASHENEFIDVGEDDDTSIQQHQQDQETFFEDDELVPLSTWTQEGPNMGQQHTILLLHFHYGSYKTVVATTRATVLVVAAVMTNMCT
jgi:hypothetical protein